MTWNNNDWPTSLLPTTIFLSSTCSTSPFLFNNCDATTTVTMTATREYSLLCLLDDTTATTTMAITATSEGLYVLSHLLARRMLEVNYIEKGKRTLIWDQNEIMSFL
jgi:hypothetical protein